MTLITAVALFAWHDSDSPTGPVSETEVGETDRTTGHATGANHGEGPGHRVLVEDATGRAEHAGPRIRVFDEAGAPVAGAQIAVGSSQGGMWRRQLDGRTKQDGSFALPARLQATDAAVFASGFRPWFGESVLPAPAGTLDVVLTTEGTLRGHLRNEEGVGLPGKTIHAISREGSTWPTTEFVTNETVPSIAMGAAPPQAAVYAHEAVTADDGQFEFRGVSPDAWRALILVDADWILEPAFIVVPPGRAAVDLVAYRATGMDVDMSRASVDTQEVVVCATSSASSRSFSLQVNERVASLRFRAPAEWHGEVAYSARTLGADPCRAESTALVGTIAHAAVTPALQPSQYRILPQWPDGTTCTNGVWLAARDRAGQPVEARVVDRLRTGYLVEVDPAAIHLAVLAEDCFRDMSEAPAAQLDPRLSQQWIPYTMPTGGDVTILTPHGDDASVVVEAAFGARVLEVPGSRVLRSLAPGPVKATCQVAGAEWHAHGHVRIGHPLTLQLQR